MANAKYVSKLCGYNIPLGPIRYDMHQANLTIEWLWGGDIKTQTAYVLDETDIDIPDIPKCYPTVRRVYESGNREWLFNVSKFWWSWINYWMLKGECYILDEC